MKALRFIVFLSLMVTVSCSSTFSPSVIATIESLQSSPLPTPDYIADSKIRNLTDECIEVLQSKIWELGNGIQELMDKFSESAQVTIDGMFVLRGAEVIGGFSLAGSHIFDGEGNIIGSTGGPMRVCKTWFGRGTHLATLEFESISGIKYAYSWIFEVR